MRQFSAHILLNRIIYPSAIAAAMLLLATAIGKFLIEDGCMTMCGLVVVIAYLVCLLLIPAAGLGLQLATARNWTRETLHVFVWFVVLIGMAAFFRFHPIYFIVLALLPVGAVMQRILRRV